MTRYERIRQEIVAIEREIAMLRHAVRDEREWESFRNICLKNEQTRERLSGIVHRRGMEPERIHEKTGGYSSVTAPPPPNSRNARSKSSVIGEISPAAGGV